MLTPCFGKYIPIMKYQGRYRSWEGPGIDRCRSFVILKGLPAYFFRVMVYFLAVCCICLKNPSRAVLGRSSLPTLKASGGQIKRGVPRLYIWAGSRGKKADLQAMSSAALPQSVVIRFFWTLGRADIAGPGVQIGGSCIAGLWSWNLAKDRQNWSVMLQAAFLRGRYRYTFCCWSRISRQLPGS